MKCGNYHSAVWVGPGTCILTVILRQVASKISFQKHNYRSTVTLWNPHEGLGSGAQPSLCSGVQTTQETWAGESLTFQWKRGTFDQVDMWTYGSASLRGGEGNAWGPLRE